MLGVDLLEAPLWSALAWQRFGLSRESVRFGRLVNVRPKRRQAAALQRAHVCVRLASSTNVFPQGFHQLVFLHHLATALLKQCTRISREKY